MIWIDIDRNSKISITNQVFTQIQEKIFSGELPAKTKLPSTRELSESLNISRNIIIAVYEQLTAEGYMYTVTGSGTFISPDLNFKKMKSEKEIKNEKSDDIYRNKIYLSGGPDLSKFPANKWKECYNRVLNSADGYIFDYPKTGGEYILKNEISKFLLRNRGIEADPLNIIITNGSFENFRIISEILNSNGKIAIEDPILQFIQNLFKSKNIELIPLEVTHDGINADDLGNENIDFIFSTPSHQYPLAVTLSAANRIRLIKKAQQLNTYIIEDDYDSEFRTIGNNLSSLYSLSPANVIYSGTFSKTLSPGLRMAFMIIPDSLIDRINKHIRAVPVYSNKIDQLSLAEFIRAGYLEKHISVMKKVYSSRYKFLIRELNAIFGNDAEIQTNGSGLHLVVKFKNIIFNETLHKKLLEADIVINTINNHSIKRKERTDNRIIVSFSDNNEKIIKDTLLKLKQITSANL